MRHHPYGPTALGLRTTVPVCTGVAVANVITGPVDFADWITESFAATFATLDNVAGVHEFALRRLLGVDTHCLLVSYTLWDSVADFDNWHTSPAFVAAHPDRTQYAAQFAQMRSIRYDLPLVAGSDIDAVQERLTRRLRFDHPDLLAGAAEFTGDLEWTRAPLPALSGH